MLELAFAFSTASRDHDVISMHTCRLYRILYASRSLIQAVTRSLQGFLEIEANTTSGDATGGCYGSW